jgi:UDP-glucose 4-epimerase/dTDP-L-rhamnose 4-epimerase
MRAHDAQTGRTVLVTGGCGHIGSRIVRQLAEAGHVVDVLDTMDAYPFGYVDEFGAARYAREVTRGSVVDPDALKNLRNDYDIIIHGAAYADVAGCNYQPALDFHANVLGTQQMLEHARASGLERFVFVSSASVYGSPPWADPATPPVWTESATVAPTSTYANSKLWGENQTMLYHQLHGLNATAVRYFSVYGEPQVPKYLSHSWCVAWFAMRASAGALCRLNGGGRQVRDFVHVDDVAEATIRAALAPGANGTVLNVGTGRPTTIRAVADHIAAYFPGLRVEDAPRPPGDPMGGYADTARMAELLGWRPSVTLPEGIERYVSWLGRNRHLIPKWITE